MPFGLGMGELVIILVIVTVVFGATKLPALGDGMGKAIRNFKRSIDSGDKDEESKGIDTKQDSKADVPPKAP
jgi:sec-independent protein translocase protein TatA